MKMQTIMKRQVQTEKTTETMSLDQKTKWDDNGNYYEKIGLEGKDNRGVPKFKDMWL